MWLPFNPSALKTTDLTPQTIRLIMLKHMLDFLLSSFKSRQSSRRSPWQNGYCERVIGSIRRECLDHIIVLNEKHLRRILKEYFSYYHESRTHLGLEKETPLHVQPRRLMLARSSVNPYSAAYTIGIFAMLHKKVIRQAEAVHGSVFLVPIFGRKPADILLN